MRFLLAVFVLAVVVIASCAAQPQGEARAEAAASFDRAAPAQGMSPSARHYRRSYRSRGRYGFGGCSGGGGNNNGGNLSNLLTNLIGQNGLLNNLGGNAAGAFCIVGLQCASGQ